jgi:tetratricopeptide (TPR) repeat protein
MRSHRKHQLMGILYHDKGLPENVLHQIKIYLNKTFTYTYIFDDCRMFINYLTNKLIAKKIILIIWSKLAETLHSLAQERPECHHGYILQLEHKLCMQSNLDASRHISRYLEEQFTRISSDIKTENSSMDDQRLSLDDLKDKMAAESSAFSVFNSDLCEKSFRYLSSESLKFLLFQSCIEVLIQIKHKPDALDGMLHLCRGFYMSNAVQMQKIDDFKKKYTPTKAIHYYSQDSFVFRQVNQAFRLEDIERIFTFRVYVTDLYQQIVECARSRPISQSHFPIYRGKKLSNTVLQQLFDNKNKLISINGFLSTTQDIHVAKMFAGVDQAREGYESALFELYIDEGSMMRNPFANIKENGMNKDELEILFTMGSVWLLEKMEWIDDCWMIELRLCDALDCQLSDIKKLANGYTFLSVGNILHELGEYSTAKNFYWRMLDANPLDEKTRGLVYYYMGLVADELGEYMDALKYFLEADKLIPITTAPSNSYPSNPRPLYAYKYVPSRLHIWNNTGRSYERKGDFENARLYYKKAFDEQSEPSEKSIVYNNLGTLEYQQGNYEEARGHFTQALRLATDYKIIQDSRQKLKNIDELFHRAGEYGK